MGAYREFKPVCFLPLHIPVISVYTPLYQVTGSAVVAELVDAQR